MQTALVTGASSVIGYEIAKIHASRGGHLVITARNEAKLNASSLAARFAAKEALAKALNAKAAFNWQEAEVVNEVTGKPAFQFSGEMAVRLAGHNVHLTLSHDAGIASAMVIVEVK